MAQPFGKLVEAYNMRHPDAPIKWENLVSDAKAKGTGWEIVTAETARRQQDRSSFVSQVAPKLFQTLVSGFVDWQQADPEGAFLPILGIQPVMIVDDEAVARGLGAVPAGLGDVFRRGAAHRQKVGRALFAPPFADPEMVLRFLHSQGVEVVDAKGKPVYPTGELTAALAPWVAAFKSGAIPEDCLNWSEAEAARQVIAGKADMTVGGPVAMAVFEARPNKTRKFHLFRPVTGKVEDQWVEPVGLVHHGSDSLSTGEQNMIAFLLDEKTQIVLANGYQMSPLVEKAREAFPGESKGLTPVMETYISAMSPFVKHGIPLAPLQAERAKVAAGIRTALVKAVEGKPIAEAIAAGQAVASAGR